jgi:P27 family predicted phage terminase small subunit
MRGRKPKPTALALLHGETNKGKKINRSEPLPPGDLDEPPEWLTEEQKAGWRYAMDNAPPGLMRRLDRGMLTVWVVAEDTHRRAAMLLAQTGGDTLLMRRGEEALPFPSLYLKMMNQQALIMVKAASELGFSPAARARAYAGAGATDGGLIAAAQAAPKGGGRQPARKSLADFLASAPPRPVLN